MPGPEDQVVDSGSSVEGGVGNGQATGTGQVSENFDMSKALDSISDGLGFKVEKSATAPVEPAKELVPPVDGAKAPEQTAPVDEAAKKAAEDAAAAAAKAAPAGAVAPKTWKPEAAALWAQVPPAVQAEVARREEDMFRGLEQYKVAASFGNTVQAELQPYETLLKSAGIEPVGLIRGLLNAEYQLSTGDNNSRIAFMQNLAKTYGIDFSKISGQQADDVYVDPDVAKLQQRIQELESGQAQVQQREAAQQRLTAQAKQAEAAQQVAAFAADSKNEFFNEVADDIVALLAVHKTMPLAEVYEKAVWANPVTRAKAQARLDADKQAAAATEAKAKAEAASRAKGVNVQSSPKAGAATMPLGTMDETMEETMRNIKNRG